MSPGVLEGYRRIWQPRIDRALEGILEELERDPDVLPGLSAAMKYAVLEGGKRLRPLLALSALRAAGGEEERGLEAACSLELVHAYSLVHDDLPAMDNDDFRRGKPTCHKRFGEALAILAGDGLLTHAFCVLARSMAPERVGQGVLLLARCAGPQGMVGGQAYDIQPVEEAPTLNEVARIHQLKTAALIEASVGLGGLLAAASAEVLRHLQLYGRALGLAYQIVDDLLDWTGADQTLGRPSGADESKNRRTYPRLEGYQGSRKQVLSLLVQARGELCGLGPQADILLALASFVQQRLEEIDPGKRGS